MHNEETLIQEVRETIEADLMNRQTSLEERQASDKVIQERMAQGEIGVTHGSDHFIGFLMFVVAVLLTVLALYIVFEINPSHYQF